MDIYNAIAEPRRRKIIEVLAKKGKLSAGQIYDEFDITSSAISQHLKVLRELDVVKMEKRAQKRIYQLNLNRINEFEIWTGKLRKLLAQRFGRMDKNLAGSI